MLRRTSVSEKSAESVPRKGESMVGKFMKMGFKLRVEE